MPAMLIASSPIAFPRGTSPPANGKRSHAQDGQKPPKPRAKAGFVLDDSSDEEDDLPEPPVKKRMLERDAEEATQYEEPAAQRADAPASLAELDSQPPSDIELLDNSQRTEEERYELLFNSGKRTSGSLFASFNVEDTSTRPYSISTCSGKSVPIRQRMVNVAKSYEAMAAARSRTREGRAVRSYYGVDIHALIDGAQKEIASAKLSAPKDPAISTPVNADEPVRSVERLDTHTRKPKKSMLWTEKYRARKFVDLVGDDLTNRLVLRWLKRWDPIVFPHTAKSKPAVVRRPGGKQQPEEEKPHRKILMLTGPPGLGKTTLAHVCARQAGYEVLEINASDDRSRDVVRGRIRTTLGTESVKTVEHKRPLPGQQQKIARPVCVVVDEVDGVVSGSGASGEGGFVKALIDLVMADQKNGAGTWSEAATTSAGRRKRKGDDFRQMRPLILICNDVYHASLRPLRQSGLAEIIHVGKPSVDAVVVRLKNIFEKEGIPCEKDAARKLCEAAWGMANGIDNRRGAESTTEGDLRGVMVVGEWVAGRLRATSPGGSIQLTRQWVDKNVLQDLSHGGGGARGIGRGGVKEIVTRIFQEGAGFPKQAVATTSQPKHVRQEQPKTQLGFSEQSKKYAMDRLREMVDTSGEVDRVMTEIFSEYPNREFNDDCYLTKPNAAYEWMHFHDTCQHRTYSNQEWELGQYFSQPVLACHHLFASPHKHIPSAGYDKKWGADGDEENAAAPLPFSGPKADYAAFEAEKQNRAMLQAIQSQLPPSLMRSFRSPEDVATEFLPYLVRLVAPDVKPVVVGGSDKFGAIASVRREAEKIMVRRAAEVLAEVGISLQKGRIEEENPSVVSRAQWVYRMEPDLDMLATFETAGPHILGAQAPTRYAVRQVLEQELHRTLAMRENAARQARFKAGRDPLSGKDDYHFDDKENCGVKHHHHHHHSGDQGRPTVAANVKRDFFGRVIEAPPPRPLQDADANAQNKGRGHAESGKPEVKVWITFHEGLNNAVRKPISLEEFLRGL